MVDMRVFARIATPLAMIICVFLLSGRIFDNPQAAQMIPDAFGPAFWPTWLLWGVGICCALWALHEFWVARKAPAAAASAEEPKEEEEYDTKLAWIGMAVVFAYGYLIQQIGFPIATFLFLITWCLLGGYRQPVKVLLVGLLGTMAFLYMFVMVALMPLDRGHGVFDGISVAIYRLLGIY